MLGVVPVEGVWPSRGGGCGLGGLAWMGGPAQGRGALGQRGSSLEGVGVPHDDNIFKTP